MPVELVMLFELLRQPRPSCGHDSSFVSTTVEAEPDYDEPAQPLARQCRRVWPTVQARLDTGEQGECRIHGQHSLHEFRHSDWLSNYLRSQAWPGRSEEHTSELQTRRDIECSHLL